MSSTASSSASGSDSDDSMSLFAPVLAQIALDNLPNFASTMRRKRGTHRLCLDSDLASWAGDCSLISPPLFGSYNILFQVQFDDGLKWLLKVPATSFAGKWNDIAARALNAEALTLQLIGRETDIPVPQIFDFDASMDSELRCAFILMEYIDAAPLSEIWFNPRASADSLEEMRLQSLSDVAKAMAQLSKFGFAKGGLPLFDEKGLKITDIGPEIRQDYAIMLERQFLDTEDNLALYYEVGPFSDPRAYILSMIDRMPRPRDIFSTGIRLLLRAFVEWAVAFQMIEIQSNSHRPFVLTHPDLSLQNVLVSKTDGRLCGLIDWDGVSAVPRCIGNESYPSWLTPDWDPASYIDPTRGQARPSRIKANSPIELASYRAKYVDFMKQAKGGDDSSTGSLTRNSLIFESLVIAVSNPGSSTHIVRKIFDEALKHSGVQANEDADEGLLLWDVCNALADNRLTRKDESRIQEGFLGLFSSP